MDKVWYPEDYTLPHPTLLQPSLLSKYKELILTFSFINYDERFVVERVSLVMNITFTLVKVAHAMTDVSVHKPGNERFSCHEAFLFSYRKELPEYSITGLLTIAVHWILYTGRDCHHSYCTEKCGETKRFFS